MELTPNNKLPFSEPQRQSPAAVIIMMLRAAVVVAKTFWPAMIVILLKANKVSETPKVLIAILLFGVLTIVFALVRYFFYFFYIEHNSLIIKTGWFKKKTLSIPLKSIQAVNLEQNVWQQVFKVTKVTFDSAGSEKVEAKIDALSVAKAEQLKQLLLDHAGEPINKEIDQEEAQPVTYKLQPADLLKLSLSANHLEAFFILFALSINLLDDLKKAFKIDGWGWIERMGGTVEKNVTLAVTILIVLAAIVSIIFSVIRSVVKYFDFTLQDTQQKWKLSFGLINRQQRIIPHPKIQVYSWHTNWIRRKIDFWMLDIKTIGQDEVRERQKLKIPLTSMEAATGLAKAYQQTGVVVPSDGLMIEPAYWIRRTLIMALPVTIAFVGISAIWLGWNSLWLGLLLIYFACNNYGWYRNYRWHANEEGLQIYSGWWGRRYTLLRWNKVQQVKVNQSPYQRSHLLASVTFDTAGGSVHLPFIKQTTAFQLSDTVLFLVESKNEPWL